MRAFRQQSSWWGREIIPEALMAVMEFLFCEVGVNRIEAGFDVNNPNSGKVMEKVGMCKEGVHRQAGRNNQGLFDLVLHVLLILCYNLLHGNYEEWK